MFTFSNFKHEWTKSSFPCDVPLSKDYKVFVNGQEVSVYTCRISAYPFNTWWPGHQRPINQTEVVSFVNLVSDEELKIEVEPLTKKADGKIMVKPYSKGIKTKREDNRIVFSLRENGAYVFEIDDYHGLLYIFNNRHVPCKTPEDVTYYFGKGVHFPGRITLKSNESVYLDKDALVYGCIFAENAENIHVYGNGILDDSGEERFSEHCYEPYTIGNVKLYDCANVRIEGVGFMNSAIWCVNLFHCFDVEIDAINVFGQWRYNTDGIDVINSQRITVKNSFIHSFDDTITIKGIDRYAFESNRDMLFEHCVLWCDWGKTCEIGLETAAPEYKNIIFRDCDILRAGSTACDIQNGDYAEVHDITFDNIRVELESFYTPACMQNTQEQAYTGKDEIEIAEILSVRNCRFREAYAFLNIADGQSDIPFGDKRYASVYDIKMTDIKVYCDEEIYRRYGSQCVILDVDNSIPTTEYRDISVENVTLNGKRLCREDMRVVVEEKTDSALSVN